MSTMLDKFNNVPLADWFALAHDQVTRKIELELRDTGVVALVNILAKRGELTPTHAHPFGHTLICGRGEIGVEKTVGSVLHLARLRAGMGLWISAGVEHTIIALEDDSGYACLHTSRTPDGEVSQEWTGWPPGQGTPRDPNDWRRTAKMLYVMTEEFGEFKPGFVIQVGQAPQGLPTYSFIEIQIPDAPEDAFWDLLDNHRGIFTKEPSKILPIRDKMLDLSRCKLTMTFKEFLAAKQPVELLV